MCLGNEGLGAEFAASSSHRDVTKALRAGLCGWRRGDGVEFLQEVLDRQHEEKVHDTSDEQEVDDCGQKVAVADLAPVDVTDKIAKIWLADDGSQKRVNDFFCERGDDG